MTTLQASGRALAAAANEARADWGRSPMNAYRESPLDGPVTIPPGWLVKASEERSETLQQGIERLERVLEALEQVAAAQEAGLGMLLGPTPLPDATSAPERPNAEGQVGRLFAQIGRLERQVTQCQRLAETLNRRLA